MPDRSLLPGHGKVFVLDPFGRVTGPAAQFRASFNPLADLDPATERGLDLAWQIADALIIQSTGDGAHWTQSARTFLRGLILYVAAIEPPASRTLLRVRDLLTQDFDGYTTTLKAMQQQGELIAQAAAAMLAKPPTERMSVVSTCDTHTAFLVGESMRSVLSGSDFRLEDLKSDRVTVYLCLPATRLSAFATVLWVCKASARTCCCGRKASLSIVAKAGGCAVASACRRASAAVASSLAAASAASMRPWKLPISMEGL